MIPKELIESTRRRHGFDDWAQPERREVHAAVLGFDVSNAALGAMRPYNVDRIRLDDALLTDAIFRVPESKEDVLLHLHLYECASREAARRNMLELLARFMIPDLRRTDVAGEVAFVFGEATMVLFARGNAVLMLRNGGRSVIPLDRIAIDLDESLLAERYDFTTALDAQLDPDGTIRFAREPQTTYLFAARGGEVRLAGDTPTLVRERPDANVTIVALRDGRSVAGARV